MAAPQEIFCQGDSLLHRLDPRIAVVAAAFLAIVLAIAQRPEVAGGGMVLGAGLVLLARLPLRDVGKRLAIVNTFTLFLWLMLPLTYGGESVVLGGLHFSRAGLQLAWLITLKTNAIICIVLSLLATSTVPQVGRAMRFWKIPEKLCLLLIFSYRYLFVIHEEYTRLRRAASMRCFVPGNNLATYRTFGNLLGMTLVNSYNRSQRVGQAMELRGFQGQFRSLDVPDMRLRDIVIGCVLLLVAIVLFILDK